MKPVPLSDHRARRQHLTASDYALHEGPEYVPSGHIKPQIWQSMVGLPDNVALQTTDHFSQAVETLHDLIFSWSDIHDQLVDGSPAQRQCLAVEQCYEGATFNAVHGWYRIAGIMIRCAFEDMLIGLYYQHQETRWSEFEAIVSGQRRSPARREIDRVLSGYVEEDKLAAANALYQDELSVYVHRTSEGEIWESNGPNFTPEALSVWIGQCERSYRTLCELIEAVVPESKATKISDAVRFSRESGRLDNGGSLRNE